ncbi:hypothetical protein [Candidatus Nanohalobium constans]|uniref:Uncharacterized protein n=1 Tax=Candidatus Nanohalobium constans TaxID=2565781 RepID=A0A5Q0UIB2_9ARCH|nr:hypothetical protein [Candidatus Nanohalobium constans]QGA80665.1 hypothetical protein LC1Nh_0781 [Candidatus Nanohalobium constans]
MPNFADSLREFFLVIASSETEIKENSLLKNRLEKLEEISSEQEIGFDASEALLKSTLDATCLSILSGNIEKKPTESELTIDEITNIGEESDRKEGLNSVSPSKSRSWLFESRVRAWYGNHLNQTFPDLTQECNHESVCEFIIKEEDKETQLVECKRFNSIVDLEDEEIERKFETHYSKASGKQFPSTENLEDIKKCERHLLIGITDYSSEKRKITGNGTEYEVEGCKEEDIEQVKKVIKSNYEDFDVDQITLVWTTLYKDKGKVKGIAERTETIISSPDVIDYEGWNLFGHKDFTGDASFGRLLCHHQAKSDNWMIDGLDADNQVLFSQQPAEKTGKSQD